MSLEKRWFDDRELVNAFLGYRYIPDTGDISKAIIEAAANEPLDLPRSELVDTGAVTLRETFETLVSKYNSDVTHVLPLSGGLDSRTILGGLLDNIQKEKIVTITFGIPGTMDHDLGIRVAEAAGVTNYSYDLSPESFPWTDELLLKNAKEYLRPTKLFRARSVLDYAFKDLDTENCVYWSGYLGEASAGSHLPDVESETWDSAIQKFQKKNFKRRSLPSPDFNPSQMLPKKPLVEKSMLSYDEQLDYGIRQPYFIRPAAVFQDSFETPYATDRWLRFILNVPRDYRLNRTLFKDIIVDLYPELFEIPSESSSGLPITSPQYQQKVIGGIRFAKHRIKNALGMEYIRASANHIDWDYSLHNSSNLRNLSKRHLSDLEEREVVPWLDINKLWNDCMSGRKIGKEIQQLVSLEIFLKAESG